MRSHEEEELCVDCGRAADGICESCGASVSNAMGTNGRMSWSAETW